MAVILIWCWVLTVLAYAAVVRLCVVPCAPLLLHALCCIVCRGVVLCAVRVRCCVRCAVLCVVCPLRCGVRCVGAVCFEQQICRALREGLDYIEDMLYRQLVSAIGKVVGPVDFQQYVRYHQRKLYRAQYVPRPFCYAVRRAGYYPEGTLAIEAQMEDGALADPIYTVVASAQAARPMYFALDAATRVAFTGERHLHGFINQQFSGRSGLSLNLVCVLLRPMRCTALLCPSIPCLCGCGSLYIAPCVVCSRVVGGLRSSVLCVCSLFVIGLACFRLLCGSCVVTRE